MLSVLNSSVPLSAVRFLEQVFEVRDLPIIGLLVILEGVLSIDNALVLGLLAKRLPRRLRSRALSYGLIGALVFRIIAIVLASYLLRMTFFKFLGGAYLVYVAVKHFFFEDPVVEDDEDPAQIVKAVTKPKAQENSGARPADATAASDASNGTAPAPSAPPADKPLTTHSMLFWRTVLVIELTDIAFAVDSIVAAMALVGQQRAHDTGAHDKLWVVIAGGMLGVILMRFAAALFIRLLEKFPRFELSAYLLVVVIGVKLLVDWKFNTPQAQRVDFHDFHSPAFWIFWGVMAACFAVGFIPRKAAPAS